MDVWSHDRADHLERLKRLDGMKVKNKATGGFWKVMENLRFPLDKTYHGCPRNIPRLRLFVMGARWGEMLRIMIFIILR